MDQIKWLNDINDNAEACPNNQLAWVGYGPSEDDMISLEDIKAEVERVLNSKHE